MMNKFWIKNKKNRSYKSFVHDIKSKKTNFLTKSVFNFLNIFLIIFWIILMINPMIKRTFPF